jgi:hypothetical protein
LNIVERDAELQRLFINGAKLSSSKELTQAVRGLHEIYLEHHGIRRKFGGFFMNLPEAAKSFIVDNYMIVPKGKSYSDPLWRKTWFAKSVDERLEKVAKYLYDYRRNKFTHGATDYQTTWPPEKYFELEKARGKPVGSHIGATLLHFFKPHDPQAEIELTVLAGKDEALVLRTVIICHCRGVLGLPNKDEFIERHITRHIKTLVLHAAIEEVGKNRQVLNYYSTDRLAYEYGSDRYDGMPEFKLNWLKDVLELDLDDYQIGDFVRNEILACIHSLQALNAPVNALNEQHPPLYLRRQRKDLEGVPEDWEAKLQAKIRLFEELRNMYDFDDAGYRLTQVENYLSSTLNRVPVAYQEEK